MSSEDQPQEYLLHPEAQKLLKLPPPDLLPVILARLDNQMRLEVPDLERVMGLGQIARISKINAMESHLQDWLERNCIENGYDVVAMFLMGFWAEWADPGPTMVRTLIEGLERYPNSVDARDSTIGALRGAYYQTRQETLRVEIQSAFASLLSIRHILQSRVREALDAVLSGRG